MTPMNKKTKGLFNTNKILPLSTKKSEKSEERLSPMHSQNVLKTSTMKGKTLKKIVFSDKKKVTKFAGLRIVIDENEKTNVIEETDSKDDSLRRDNSIGSNLNPF